MAKGKDVPAFPRTTSGHGASYDGQTGMTLRDYFAAKAMQGDIASVERGHDWVKHAKEFAKHAYTMADAMLEAREK